MSWIERISKNIIIETGDGQLYFPKYLNAQYVIEYNVEVFEFIDVEGSFVRRKKQKGRKFSIEIYFTGQENIETAEAFRRSAGDSRHWHIKHPIYDEIRVQPISLKFDNSQMNVTKITGTVVETTAQIYPRGGISKLDQIQDQKDQTNATAAADYAAEATSIQANEITTIKENTNVLESNGNKVFTNNEEKVAFRNAIVGAQNAINNISAEPLAAMRAIQAAVNLPISAANTVEARVNTFFNQYNRLEETFVNITEPSRNDKKYFEIEGANYITAAAVASVANLDSYPYENRKSVDFVINKLIELNNAYLVYLDSLQTESQTEADSYAPDPDVIGSLQDLITLTISALFEIALDALKEITIINEADSNPVILTHRIYGLDQQDENLDRFIKTNNIGLKEMFLIPKDRELIYYV